MTKTIHKAQFILAEPNLLFQNAAIHISSAGRISRIEAWPNLSSTPDAAVVDWGSALIIPGLVNAHTHLELTGLKNPLTNAGSFTDWISKLVHARRQWTREQIFSSAQEGMQLSLASGTTLVGDISSSAVSCAFENQQLRRVYFEEVLAFAPDRADEILSSLHLEKEISGQPLSVHGISPHAPYSVSAQLYQGAAKLARIMHKPLSTHAAETLAELQFLKTGTGEFRDFLNALNLLPLNWKPPGLAPIAYLDSLGVLGPSCLLAHCNYLDKESIETIANSHSHVVYCPRSHHFFGHTNHPIRSLLDSGINVSLGTDSLASNESLSLIDEMRFLFKTRKDLQPEEILQAATLNGAAALGFDGVLGCLKSGYCADMTILEVPNAIGSQRLLEQMLEGGGDCIATIVQGKIAWQKNPQN
jgi:cytosine/adenosine deaminase-related metal-dependent hydrolase